MKTSQLALTLCLAPLLTLLPSCAGRVPDDIGVHGGRLTPCPDSPNCVSSMADNPDKRVDPLPLYGNSGEAMDCLERLVHKQPRAEVLRREPGYLHAAYASRIFGFVDDVEFMYDPDQNVIQLRSAARLGYYDFGVNRKRVEQLAEMYAQQCLERDNDL